MDGRRSGHRGLLGKKTRGAIHNNAVYLMSPVSLMPHNP